MKLKQYKIARRLGVRIFPKTENPKLSLTTRKRTTKKRPRPMSEFGLQLIEKQKVRYLYGLRERQFSNYVKEATMNKTINPAESLYRSLELRLDTITYKLGFAKTQRCGRQIVSHGHITVNGKRASIPSYRVRKGDRISLRKNSQDKPYFQSMQENIKEHGTPPWLSLDFKKMEGEVIGEPTIKKEEHTPFNLTSIIEFYSR